MPDWSLFLHFLQSQMLSLLCFPALLHLWSSHWSLLHVPGKLPLYLSLQLPSVSLSDLLYSAVTVSSAFLSDYRYFYQAVPQYPWSAVQYSSDQTAVQMPYPEYCLYRSSHLYHDTDHRTHLIFLKYVPASFLNPSDTPVTSFSAWQSDSLLVYPDYPRLRDPLLALILPITSYCHLL